MYFAPGSRNQQLKFRKWCELALLCILNDDIGLALLGAGQLANGLTH